MNPVKPSAKPTHFDTCIDENCERKACVDRRNPPQPFIIPGDLKYVEAFKAYFIREGILLAALKYRKLGRKGFLKWLKTIE